MSWIKVYTKDPAKKRQVLAGRYSKETNTFLKVVKPEHYMKVEDGWGIQESVLARLVHMGAKIKLKTASKMFEIPAVDWVYYGRVANYGNGEQCFISWDNVKKYGQNQNK